MDKVVSPAKVLCLLLYIAFSKSAATQPKYEFRAAWVATVDNIDWPSAGNYNTESQKKEFIALLDMHQQNGLNAVIVQIRPATDAFYPSQYEPWSEWLTGKQGKPPASYYDPLQFMIEETHKRGMEFHAWCNPYRAEFQIGKSSIAPTHVTKIHPEWFIAYGNKKYFDPGNKEAQRHVVAVIRDIVSRYDIDAIHFDDYFYPYRIIGKEFPDAATYDKYGNGMDKNAWRRSNVDSIILMLSKAIKEENKYCKFGISPFGVWRNKKDDPDGSETLAGQTNYDDLYADVLLWLKKGWIDYVAPQLYWEFGHKAAPYEVLLDWWSRHTYGRHCYIGLGIYKAGSNGVWKDSTLLPRQIVAQRNAQDVKGAIYFSSKSFIKNPNGWNDSLRHNYYKYPSLIPPMEWISSTPPAMPKIKKIQQDSSIIFYLDKGNDNDNLKGFAVYTLRQGDTSVSTSNPIIFIPYSKNSMFKIKPSFIENDVEYLITAINRYNNESRPIQLLDTLTSVIYGYRGIDICTNLY